MQIGIVGLPSSGKSTLFQAVAKAHLDFSAITKSENRHAIVKVPDVRLDTLSDLFGPRSTVHAVIDFVDVAGLKKGESGSTQFTTNFLGSVKTNDALVQIVRAFTNDAVPHPDNTVDVLRDLVTFETEFILSDLSIAEKRIDRIKKQLMKGPDERLRGELSLLEKCHHLLEHGNPLRNIEFSKEEAHALKSYQLLSIKPMLIALNFDETQQEVVEDYVKEVAAKKDGRGTKVVWFSGKIDKEMAELPEDEARAFMDEYGIRESALSTLIREAYALLGLQSFFTVGDDECRAWTIRKGMTAQEAAGVIHSSFSARFIRAEVVQYDNFIQHGGSFAKAKEAGQWRLEGKDYVVRDGDIMSIRHS